MILDLQAIPPEGLVFDQALDLRAALRGDAPAVRAVRLAGRVARHEGQCELAARLDAVVELECSRCLEAFPLRLNADFHLRLAGDASEFGPRDCEIGEDEAALFYATDGKADLREIAAEQVLLNLPLKPVCSDSCRGLCPTCGADRNRIECGCRAADADPRLEPLADLRERLRSS
jgi:uncharacterized protein